MAKKPPLTIDDLRRLGGIARMNALTPEERAEMGRKGAVKRWKKQKAAGKSKPTK